MIAECFPPIARADAKLLILGSLPGEESLRRQEYYAQKRNAFWKIIERLFGIDAGLQFPVRAEKLMEHSIAVWDVCAVAERAGSLDSAIKLSSIIPNDFASFFVQHPAVTLVCFNGRKAEDVYNRVVLPLLPPAQQVLQYKALPSTSPAHAGLSFEKKCLLWQEAMNEFISNHYDHT